MEQQYNGLQIPQNDAISLKSRNPQISPIAKLMSLRSAIILIAEKDISSLTLPLPLAKPMLSFLAPTICLPLDSTMSAMMAAHLTILMMNQKDEFYTMSPQWGHLQTVAPVSGTTQKNGDYFELAGTLQRGVYCNMPLPFRTVIHHKTALHLTRDPTIKTMRISDVMDNFNLPDLHGTLANFLD